ncbi:MAG TPA: PKD domain-containing protein [Bacteroidia bacterium]|jgi:gliding motility-associated-like protein
MQCRYNQKLLLWLSFIISFIITHNEAHASHAQGADLTYQCLGGNQYQLTLSFYRDCGGVNAPASVTINCSSASCNQNYNVTLLPLNNTGNDVTPICPNVTTQCNGGNVPGVQEWIYTGITTLPMQCTDWVFSFTLCCRNAAITTILNPGSQNIYVQATLNNFNFPCDNSPVFSNRPIPYVCVGQNFCFNNGASDPDGDSLSFQLITPQTGPNTTVSYLNPYSATQPLSSSPPVTFNPATGDMCMTPSAIEITVFAVLVEEWRGGNLVGTVVRDIQLHTMTCNNNLPYIDGINGTNTYSMNTCAGQLLTFFTNTYDPDQSQNVTITWNNGITNATFTSSGGSRPTGTFSWTPTQADISNVPHCFTVTVMDNNCPYNGSQTFSFCITVSGLTVNTTQQNTNCGASNGSATAMVSGGTGPYSYQWLPNGGNSATANGLIAGTYTVNVADVNGCMGSAIVTIINNGTNANLTVTSTNVSCAGGNNGSATVTASGGQQPYSYLWSTGATTQTIIGLIPGNYTIAVTTANGCTSSAVVTITQPSPLVVASTQTNALCFGSATGTATVAPGGGTAPYSYLWNNNQNTATANNLAAGNYFCTVTDAHGCTAVINVQITQPAPLQLSITSVTNVICNGGNNGSATVLPTGGTAPYNFSWGTSPAQTSSTATGLGAGNYSVLVSDANGCTTTIIAAISQPSPVAANLSATSVSCYGNNTGTTTAFPSGGNGPYSYQWNTNPIQTTQTATGLAAGTYAVIVTDANGCSTSASISVSQPAPLVTSISNVINVSCNGGNNGSAVANSSGGTSPYSYSWTTNPTQLTQNVTGLGAGTYTVYISDLKGCTTSAIVTIAQPAALSLTATGFDTICPGQNVTISASASGGNGGYTYSWNQNIGFGATHVVNPNATTTYTCYVTDNMGCTTVPQAVTVSVYSITPTNIVITPPQSTICAGASITMNTVIIGLTGPVTYSWSHNLGNSPGPVTVTPSATTTYSLYVTNICGMTVVKTATVTVDPLPVIALTPQGGTGCDRVPLQFVDGNAANNSGSSYSWNFGDGNYSSQVSPVHDYTVSGTYTVTLVVTSPAGCSTTAATLASAVVNASPDAEFNADPPTATTTVPVIHFFNTSVNASQYSWTFGDGNNSTQVSPTHTYAQKGTYTVTLYTVNQAGCMDTIAHTVEIDPEFAFYIPNAFTPDGDGKNDVFNGKGEEITEFSMQIFDRWGELIYRTEDLDKGWDGTANGGSEIVQEGVYVYKIELRDFKNRQHFYDGSVTLIK